MAVSSIMWSLPVTEETVYSSLHLQLVALRVYGLLDVRVLKTVRSDVFQTARANSTKQSSHFTNAC